MKDFMDEENQLAAFETTIICKTIVKCVTTIFLLLALLIVAYHVKDYELNKRVEKTND